VRLLRIQSLIQMVGALTVSCRNLVAFVCTSQTTTCPRASGLDSLARAFSRAMHTHN
jgi:hypothetical protein